jgi:hypothetical protein
MDDEIAFAVLKFWMALGRITLMNPGANNKQVIRRLSAFFRVPYGSHEPLILSLIRKRNRLVHEGRVSEIEVSDSNYLRWLFENALPVLLRQVELHRTVRQLDIFIQLGALDEGTLRDHRKLSLYTTKWKGTK